MCEAPFLNRGDDNMIIDKFGNTAAELAAFDTQPPHIIGRFGMQPQCNGRIGDSHPAVRLEHQPRDFVAVVLAVRLRPTDSQYDPPRCR